MPLCRFRTRIGDRGPAWGWVDRDAGSVRQVDGTLSELLRLGPGERAARLGAWQRHDGEPVTLTDVTLLAPVDAQEIWAAGVTYERSREARMEESSQQDVYDKVYSARRPEVFFKSQPWRCLGDAAAVAYRADSDWNVPEPELAIVLDSAGRIAGYTVGNDVSSRSIEGENPLYLPQAKLYSDSCSLGPWIVFPDEIDDPMALEIRMQIDRPGSTGALWQGTASTSQLHRSLEELAGCLFSALDFPDGAVLLTGTCLVPEAAFTLQEGDIVRITIDGIGVLRNPVRKLKTR